MLKKPKSEEDTANQQCIVGRIGQWILKKVTKGKKEEQIPTETLEPESETAYVNTFESPRLQILCRQVPSANGPEGSAQATATSDNSVEPERIDTTTDDDVNPETTSTTVISLKELCLTMADSSGGKITDVNDIKHDVANEEPHRLQILCQQALCANGPEGSAQATAPSDSSVESETINKTTDDNVNSETDSTIVVSLKELCMAVVDNTGDKITDVNDSKHDVANDEPHRLQILCQQALSANGPEGSAQVITPSDSSVESESINKTTDDNVNSETDSTIVVSLKELCMAVVDNTGDKITDVNDIKHGVANDEPHRLQILCQQALSANRPEGSAQATATSDNSVEPERTDTTTDNNANPETDNTTVISLKELCMAVTDNSGGKITDVNHIKHDVANEEPHRLQILCQQALCANRPEGSAQATATSDSSDEPQSIDKTTDDNVNSETDSTIMVSLKELCMAVVDNTGDKITDVNDIKHDVANDEPHRLQILCQQALSANGPEGSAQVITPSDSSVESESINKTTDDNVNSETDSTIVVSLKELCMAVVDNTGDKITDVNDIKHGVANDEPHRLQILCQQALSANGPEGSAQVTATSDNSVEHESTDKTTDNNANPETDNTTVISLKELCMAVTDNSGGKITDVNDIKHDVANEEPHRLQILCQQALCANRPEGAAQATATSDSSDEPQSIDKTTDDNVNSETDSTIMVSLKELCMAVVDNTGGKITGVNDIKHDVANDEPHRLQILCQQTLSANGPEGYAQAIATSDNSVEPESIGKTTENNANPETDNTTVISLKELCMAVAVTTGGKITDVNDIKHDVANEEPHRLQILCQQALCANRPEGSAQATATSDSSIKPERIDKTTDDNVNSETDSTIVVSLKELCMAVVDNTGDKITYVNDSKHDVANDEPHRLQILCQQALSANGPEGSAQVITPSDSSVEPERIDTTTDDNVNPETDTNIVLSLKKLCMAETDNTDIKSMDMNDSNQDLDIDDAQPTDHDCMLDNDEYNQVSVMSLKDMCKTALTYPDDLEYNFDHIKTDHTDEQESNIKSDPELDTASINSECDCAVLISLIQMCTKEVNNADTNIDDKETGNDAELITKGANQLGFASEETLSEKPTEKKTKLNKIDMKPKHKQITVMSLKNMCEAAIKYADDSEHFINTKTDDPYEKHSNGISDAEPDTASIGSESEGGVLMTLIQLYTEVISNAEEKITTNADDKYSAKDIKLHPKDVNHECDAKKLMSLKDICTTVVSSAHTADVIGIKNTDSKTTDTNGSKQEFTKEPIEKKIKLNEDDMKLENDQKLNEDGMKSEYDKVTVMSLKEICKSALTYHDILKYNTDATKAHHINDKLDVDDPELDNDNKIFEIDDSILMTRSQLCAKVISNFDGRNTSDRDAKDIANDSKLNTEDMKLECDDKRLKSLKDICEAVIKSAASRIMVVNGAERSSDVATKFENTRILKNDANDTTAKYLDDKELSKSTDNQQEINLENKLKYNKSTPKSLKELCLMKLGNVDDMKASNSGAQKHTNYEKDQEKSNHYDINPTTDNKLYNANFIKQGNTDTECDIIDAKSLKELCTITARTTNTDNAKVRTKDVYPEQDKVQYEDNKAHDEQNDSDNLDVSSKSDTAQVKSLQKAFYSVNGNQFDKDFGMQNIEKDYVFVKVTDSMDENCKTNQYSVEEKSKCLRDVRSAASKTFDGTNTTINEINCVYAKRQNKSKEYGNGKQDIKSQPDKFSEQSEVKSCIEQFRIAGKFYKTFKQRQGSKAGLKRGHDQNKVKFLQKQQKASSKDAGDQKIGIRYYKSVQDSGIQFKLEEELSQIMIENTKAIAMTLKELTNADKGSEKEFKTEHGYKSTFNTVYDKNKLRSLTGNRPVNEIILENDKAIAMTLKELSSAADDNADNMLTRTCNTTQVQVNNTNKFNIHESNTLDLFSGYDPNSPMTLEELYLKPRRKNDGVKEDINNILRGQAANKDRDGAVDIRTSMNRFSDMTDNMQKHYLLTAALLSLMEMCDKESIQIKDEDIDQYMTKESDTKKECVRELFHLVENLNKISEATMINTTSMDETQEQKHANDAVRHQTHSKEIRKADDTVWEERATDSSMDVEAVNTKNQFRKTKEIQSITDKNLVQTTDQETVYGISEIDQMKEDALGGFARNKENQKNVCDSNLETDITSVNDDETDCLKHANKTNVDKVYKDTQTHDDIIGISQMDDTAEKEPIDVMNVNADGLQNMEVISAGEETNQNVEVKPSDKKRNKAAKGVNGKGRDTGQERIMENIKTKTAAARTTADEAGIEYERDNKTDKYRTNLEPEGDSQGNNQELFLPVETVCDLMVDTYNDRRYKTKKKSRNKARLQFEIDYQINMNGKIIAAKVPENLHTLTANEYTLPDVDEENMKKRKKRNANSHGAEKAAKDRKRDKGARQSSHTLPEQKTGAKLKQNSRCNENENITLAAVYCDGEYSLFEIIIYTTLCKTFKKRRT